ncbi:MAG: hypothetical protein O3A76_17235 [Chloroflexi bacterium]|nr:hypothetical protein [Chloroflexota bacterium]
MVIDAVPTVRLHGHPGQLRFVRSGVRVAPTGAADADTTIAPPGDADAPQWIWEGDVDGPGLVAMVRAALQHGIVPCEVDGHPHRARATGCWYDAGRGTVVIELAGRPEPLV